MLERGPKSAGIGIVRALTLALDSSSQACFTTLSQARRERASVHPHCYRDSQATPCRTGDPVMSKRTPTFNVGDKVAYSVQWLKSVGLSHSEYSRARGEVTATKPCGGMTLVSVDWSSEELP